jgi:eukaryotic-like serine/threonine-protein kinase
MAYRVGRYQVHEPISSGGMAVVHLGRIVGPVGFSRTVAIKRLHPHLATDPEFVAMFLDEARLAARVQHPNVVATIDVVASHGQLFLVMDFVLGASLSQLLRSSRARALEPPPAVVSAIVTGALYGLHAAHEARDERGESLAIVHRDISPQNLLVGIDGVTRVVDFGVAKAAARGQSTRDGQLKGKLAYMAPEQILRKTVDRRADVYAAGVVLWEALTLRRLFVADDEGAVIAAVLQGDIPPPSELRRDLPPGIDGIMTRAVSRDPSARFPTAQDFAAALEAAIPPAPQREVGAWVEGIGGADIDVRRGMVSAVEQSPAIESDTDDKVVEGLVAHTLSPQEARKLATSLTATLPSRGEHAHGDTEVAAVPARPPPRATGLWVGGAIGVAAVTAAAVVASARSSPRREVPESAAAPVASATTSSTAGPPASSEPSPPAASEASGGAPAASSSTAHRVPARPASAPRPHAPAPARGASCDPPFSLDASGVKRFKPWCI